MNAPVYTVDDFPYEILRFLPRAKRPKGKPRPDAKSYADVIATFDIETTNLPEIKQAVMWHWQTCIDGMVVTGRTWKEYDRFLDAIDRNMPKGLTLVFYVHNLAFEFEFLRAIHTFEQLPALPRVQEVFCITGRKVAKANIGRRFEYRCSYVLTNMSLREFLTKYKVEHQKEEMDYTIRRFPWTPVTEEEKSYCINDVLGLWEALRRMMKADGNTVADIPITSTGYVRQDFKKAMKEGDFIPLVRECAPDWDLYLAIRRAFRGGNTHGSRMYTGLIMENVTSMDMSSAYPGAICNMPFPVRPFVRQHISRLEEVEERMPYILHVAFTGIQLSDPFWGCPYLALHKCQNLRNAINDNGRIVQADRLETYITDVDLGILQQEYVWDDCMIIESWRSEYGMLPEPMREVTMDYFRKKTELKGVEGMENYYMKAKNKLNSIYGMTATNPVRVTLQFDGTAFSVKEMNDQTELEKANRKSFTVFAWGCWVTCWCRYWLERALQLCGHRFIYCDTDSVKFVGDVDFTDLNNEIRELSTLHGSYADDPAGNRHYLQVYEKDATYKRFAQLGAKKYAYDDDKGFHITIAGVAKSGAEEMGCLENFYEGFVFHKSGGVEAFYNDEWGDPIEIDGHQIELPPNVYLQPGEYTLGLTLEYKRLFHLTQEQYYKILKSR